MQIEETMTGYRVRHQDCFVVIVLDYDDYDGWDGVSRIACWNWHDVGSCLDPSRMLLGDVYITEEMRQ